MMRRFLQHGRQVRCASSLVGAFEKGVNELPMREAMRYTEKNIKWTASEFKTYVDAQANGLLDLGFTKGDNVAVWMKDSAERDVTYMALAKVGLKVVEAPPTMTVPQLRQFLGLAPFKIIYFDPVSESQDCLLQLRKAIPEFYDYDDNLGQLFHSKYFPSLRYFIHTGFDQECGCLNYKRLFLPNTSQSFADKVEGLTADNDHLYMKATIGSDGALTAGQWQTHEDVKKNNSWNFEKNLRAKTYFEV